ncbi:hypothetical protein ACFL3C_04325 [Patescibacteria group bacterium]
MADEMKTKAIPAMLQETEDTGLITDDSLEALKAKRLQAEEKIENLIRLHGEGKISEERMKVRINTIREEIQTIQDQIIASDFDDEILS